MFWLNFIFKLISVLQSGKDPRNIAGGFALGMVIGLTPILSLHNLIIALVILVLDVSIPAALFAIFIGLGFAYIFDPQFHALGYFLLVQVTALKPFWTQLYNLPIAPLTKFYNTVVLGSLVSGLVLLYPIYFGFKLIVKWYQLHLAEKVARLRIVQIINGNSLIQLYNRIKFQ